MCVCARLGRSRQPRSTYLYPTSEEGNEANDRDLRLIVAGDTIAIFAVQLACNCSTQTLLTDISRRRRWSSNALCLSRAVAYRSKRVVTPLPPAPAPLFLPQLQPPYLKQVVTFFFFFCQMVALCLDDGYWGRMVNVAFLPAIIIFMLFIVHFGITQIVCALGPVAHMQVQQYSTLNSFGGVVCVWVVCVLCWYLLPHRHILLTSVSFFVLTFFSFSLPATASSGVSKSIYFVRILNFRFSTLFFRLYGIARR